MFKIKLELELLLDNQSIGWILVSIQEQLAPAETVETIAIELIEGIKEVKP